jgi:hypothetical protein
MWHLSRPHPERLVVTAWPHPVALVFALFFAAFGLYGGLFSISTGSETVFRCHRQADGSGSCRLVESGPQRHRDQSFSLASLRMVTDDDVSDGDPICWLRVTDGRRRHLLVLYSGHDSHDRATAVVTRFKAFKAGFGPSTFVTRKDDRGITSAFGCGFIAFGLLPLLTFTIRRVRVDRSPGRLSIRRWGLIPWQVLDVPTAEVARVHIAETTDSDGDRTYRLMVDLRSGRSVPLLQDQSTRPERFEPVAQAIVDLLPDPTAPRR